MGDEATHFSAPSHATQTRRAVEGRGVELNQPRLREGQDVQYLHR